MIKRERKPFNTNYSVPIIKLSNYNFSNQERQQLKLGLDYCYVDKNKDVRRFQTANTHFHEFLSGYTDIFTNSIFTKDYTYHNLSGMIQNKDIVHVFFYKHIKIQGL